MTATRDHGRGVGDELASALPEQLSVSVELPAQVHETPDDEAMVAIDEVAITPVPEDAPTTRSIAIVPELVLTRPEPVGDAELAEPGPPALPGDDPRTVHEPDLGEEEPAPADEPHWEQVLQTGRRVAPEGIWPEFVYGITLHLVNIGDSPRVRARKELDARIARDLGRPVSVPVLSRKGGVGASTIALLLGMALADARRDGVLAVDAHGDRGTLIERVIRRSPSTVRDVVHGARGIQDSEQLAKHVSRDATRLDVLASTSDVSGDAFGPDGFNVVSDIAERYYGVILSDVGAGLVAPLQRAAVQRADAAVLVSGASIDEARAASDAVSWLEANGAAELAANLVLAVNTATPGTDLDQLDEIEAHFAPRVRAVVRIPYDPGLAAGGTIRWNELEPLTRSSARDLAALLVDGLAPQRVLAAPGIAEPAAAPQFARDQSAPEQAAASAAVRTWMTRG